MNRSTLLRWGVFAVVALTVAAGVTAAVAAGDSGTSAPEAPSTQGQEREGQRPWLGFVVTRGRDVKGLVVRRVVEGGPAAQAGLAQGDVITEVDGTLVDRVRDLVNAVKDKSAGDEVTLTVRKSGLKETDAPETEVKVTLGERPAPKDIKDSIQGKLQEQFGEFLGGEFRFKDKEGNIVNYAVHAGEVKAVSDDALTITASDGSGEKKYTISDDSRVPGGLEAGDKVVVASVDGAVKFVRHAGFRHMFKGPFWDFGKRGWHSCPDGDGGLNPFDNSCVRP
jgi:membrane-associated protease RseP (regulator of RpoE activity)